MDRIPKPIQKVIEDYIIKLSEKIVIDKAIIFGSYAKGNIHKYSDIDLAIFSNYFKNMHRVDGIYFLLMNAVDYEIDLEPQPFTMEEYYQPVGLVKEIIRTGIEVPLPVLP